MAKPSMSEQTEYSYDMFISYSHRDGEWVRQWLLPRLEDAGLRVCIDFRDFDIGVPNLVNMERAVDNSRRTLLVLTPAWLESEWTEFEALLIQTTDPAGQRRRLLPILLQPCQPPRRITMLTYADFTRSEEWETQLQRVVAAVRGELRLRDVGPPLSRLLEPEVPFLAPPRPPYNLVGRDGLLCDLKQQLFAGGSLALSALNGLPGVGKTALAVELAHDREVLGHFQDGVLWAGLGREASKEDVLSHLGTWGMALGISSTEIARLTTIEDRTNAIHAAIGMRRMLLVLDDAWQDEAALAFKLGGPNCAHMVTTRLPEVALRFAGEGTTVVYELREPNGLTLLARLAPEVVEAEPDETLELVRAVGGLPLALILMGNYLRLQAYSGQPRRLRAALDRLRQAEERLRLAQPQPPLERHPSLPADVPLSLLAVIGISDEALDEEGRHTLRALSVFPPKPNSFSEEAALAVSGMCVQALDTLTDYGLLESNGPGRYTLHQTIADYGTVKLADMTTYERMIEYFVDYVETHKTEYDTLDLESRNILAALQTAYDRRMLNPLIRGVNAFYPFLDTRGLYSLAKVHLSRVLQSTKASTTPNVLITVLLNLGRVMRKLGDFVKAEEHLLKSLRLARKIGHRESIADLLLNLGGVAVSRGDYRQAEKHYKKGLDLVRGLGDRDKISALLSNWGTAAFNSGGFDRATELYEEGLVLAREIGHSQRIGDLLMGLGAVADSKGDYDWAEDFYQQALTLTRKIGHRERTCVLLSNLGGIAEVQGDHTGAELYLEQGLALAREIGHRENICLLLMNLGEVKHNRGDYHEAERLYREGLALAIEIGQRKRISALLANLGVLEVDSGDYPKAKEYFSEALVLAREIGQRWLVSSTLNQLSELHFKQKDFGSASTAFLESLDIAQEIGVKEFIASSSYGLAQVTAAQGNTVKARHQGQESLTIFEAIGHNKAAEVAQWLDTL